MAEGAVLRCGGTPPDDPALAGGYYFLPTVLDGCVSGHGLRAGRVIRPGADGGDVPHGGRGRAHRQRHDVRPGRRGVVVRRQPRPARRRRAFGTAPSGSTTTTRTCPRRSGAASSSPGSGRELGPDGAPRVPRGEAHLPEPQSRPERLVRAGPRPRRERHEPDRPSRVGLVCGHLGARPVEGVRAQRRQGRRDRRWPTSAARTCSTRPAASPPCATCRSTWPPARSSS